MAHQATHNRLDEVKAPRAGEATAQQQAVQNEETMRRAEEMVDRIGARVGEITAFLGHQLLRLGSRAREEVEDMWAEAQNLRRGRRP